MGTTDEAKRELARTLADDSPWMNLATARHAIGILDDAGVIRKRGREVLPDEVPKGALYRVEYDVHVMNHITRQSGLDRHVEVTRKATTSVVQPQEGATADVKNVRYFIVEEPPLTVPEHPGHTFKATNGNGPVEWAFATLVDDRVVCIDTKDFSGQIWHRQNFESLFTVTEVLS